MGTSAPGKKYVNQKNENIPSLITDNLNGNNDLSDIPNDQYLCPNCKNVPELVNIFTANGFIELKCKDHGSMILKVKEYFKNLENSENIYYNFHCSNCNKIQKKNKKEIFQFCYNCRHIFCLECNSSHCGDNRKCINVNEMNVRCPTHFNEQNYTRYCLDDKENVCEKYSTKKHRKHNIKSFFRIETDKKVIQEKNEILRDLIRFNELILNTYEKFPDNYFHNINVQVLAESIKAENARDPKELENLFKELERNIKIQNDAIKEIKNKYNIYLNGKEEKLILRNKGLNDNALKIFSKIKFINLKEIDLSFNNIKNIEYLENHNSGSLEYLSLNNNKIEDLTPLEHMNLSNLKELNLQNNCINETIVILEKVVMPKLNLLRLENNGLEPSMKGMKKVIDKFKIQTVYIPQTVESFYKKYEINIKKDTKKLDFNGKKGGNCILRDLYLILPKENLLDELRIADCGIDNIETLSRICLPQVRTIDLCFNKIIHIEPLCHLQKNKLKIVYLNDNNISDISPLKRINFYENSGKVTIENNNIIMNDEVKRILTELKKKHIDVQIDDNVE